jgi:flagellar biosynthesis protein FliQ
MYLCELYWTKGHLAYIFVATIQNQDKHLHFQPKVAAVMSDYLLYMMNIILY